MTRKLTVKELHELLLEPFIAECASNLGTTTKLMDLKIRIIGFATGFYGEPCTFEREDLIEAMEQIFKEEDE